MKGRNLLLNLFVVLMGLSISVTAQENNNSTDDQKTYLEKARANQQTGNIDPADVLKAREQMKKMDQGRSLGLDWLEMGPDNFGGHVTAVLIDNQDESGNTIYVGAFTGGIWKSTNGGVIWEKINQDEKNIFVSDFAQDEDGTIYAATGMDGAYTGQGIYYKSPNNSGFTQMGSTAPTLEEDTWSYISEIELTSDKIYAATSTGLMISSDDGDSWDQAATEEGALEGRCNDVAVTENGTIFTAIEGTSYRSESNTSGFVSISGDADTLVPSNMVKQVKFAVTPQNSSRVYAMATDYSGFLVGVYISDDEGITWSLIGPGTDSDVFSPFSGDADEAASIVVSPNDPGVIYVGGVAVYRGVEPNDDGYYTWEREFQTSLGVNDFFFRNSNEYIMATNLGIYSFNRNEIEPIGHNIYLNISSFNSVSLGVDNKVLGGENRFGILHFPMENVNTDLNAKVIQSGKGGYVERSIINHNTIILNLETNSDAVQGGSNENMYRSRDMGEAFAQNFLNSDIGYNGAEYDEQQFLQFKLWESMNNQQSMDSVYFTADNQSYSAGDVVNVRSEAEDYPFEYELENDLNQGDSVQVQDIISGRLYIAAEGTSNSEVWMTPDIHNYGEALDWYQIAELGDNEIPSTVAVSENGNYAYVGTDKGAVYRLGNLLAAHDSATANYDSDQSVVSNDLVLEEEDRMVTSIATDPNDNNHIVITLGNYGNDNYVYESFNTLADEPDFSSIQYDLPKVPVYSSLVEMHNSNRVLIGTEMGVFALEDDSWTVERGEVGSLPVTQIRQQTKETETKEAIKDVINGDTAYRVYEGVKNNGMIYMSTFGRGIWKSANYVGIGDQPEGSSSSVSALDIYPNPAREIVSISMKNSQDWLDENSYVHIYDINGRLVLSQPVNAADSEMTVNISSLSEGAYMMQISNDREKASSKFLIQR
ncbi:MAG: T9SS type A sorting domain-containing protein [Bacteroidales bacterium]|nr:T9SS type A sorting domain-containing protein [Bacteroidales bacterium]MCF8337345.1 T9SS type A sorting domain-containing protein [Bacteroidales bacterium]